MTEHWLWPQWTKVGLIALSLVFNAIADGTPKTGNNSFSLWLVSALIGTWILYCGGFWS